MRQGKEVTLATSADWARPFETALATSMGVVTHATQFGIAFPSGKVTAMGSWDAPRISSARLAFGHAVGGRHGGARGT